jgi:hypothetical protein
MKVQENCFKMKQPNPNNYDSEEEYEKAQSQYEDYADEKYEQEKEDKC